MYKIIEPVDEKLVCFDGDGFTLWIATDAANTDYQQYLEWLAEGNEPEVTDLSG